MNVNADVLALAEHVTTDASATTGRAHAIGTATPGPGGGASLTGTYAVNVEKTGPGEYVGGYLDNINNGAGVASGTIQVDV